MRCYCGEELQPRPVPGALHYPKRLECPLHGYMQEKRSGFEVSPEAEAEKPNRYEETVSLGDMAVEGINPED